MQMFSLGIMGNFLLLAGLTLLILQIYIDCRYRILLDEFNLGLLVLGGGYAYLQETLHERIPGIFVLGGLLGLIYWLSKDGLGLGDVKLGMALGIWLGPLESWICLLLALILGSVIGAIGWLSGSMNRKSCLPFGPFLIAGALMAFYRGNEFYRFFFD